MISLIDTDSRFDAVIIAAGDYPSHPIPLAAIGNARMVVCCDGAVAAALAHGVMPDAVVGDGDSLNDGLKMQLADRLHIISEQDYNDLTKATRYVISNIGNINSPNNPNHPNSPLSIAYLAATGKREDHTLGNISLMRFYHEKLGVVPTMITDHGTFSISNGNQAFASVAGQQVSIFNLTCKNISGAGLRWPPYPFDMLWQGTLNEALNDHFCIEADGYYLVFREHH